MIILSFLIPPPQHSTIEKDIFDFPKQLENHLTLYDKDAPLRPTLVHIDSPWEKRERKVMGENAIKKSILGEVDQENGLFGWWGRFIVVILFL